MKRTLILLAAVSAAFILSLTTAAALPAIPTPPNTFYGTATIDGLAMPDGLTVTAKIKGVAYGSSITSGGKYGYSPLLKIKADDPSTPAKEGGVNGETIKFYVKGLRAAELAEFADSTATQLSLAFTSSCGDGWCSGAETSGSCPEDCAGATAAAASPTSASGGGGGAKCEKEWTCDGWAECITGKQTRECDVVRTCGEPAPETEQECEPEVLPAPLTETSHGTEAAPEAAGETAGVRAGAEGSEITGWAVGGGKITPASVIIAAVVVGFAVVLAIFGRRQFAVAKKKNATQAKKSSKKNRRNA